MNNGNGYPLWAKVLAVIAAIFVFGGMMFRGVYNSFKQTYNELSDAKVTAATWMRQIDEAYQRRLEVTQDLVTTVEEYTNYASDVYSKLTVARASLSAAIDSGDYEKMQTASNELQAELMNTVVLLEDNPDLGVKDLYEDLMASIEGSANRVSTTRYYYNESVGDYDTIRNRFPTVLWAGFVGFNELETLKLSEGAKSTSVVEFKH